MKAEEWTETLEPGRGKTENLQIKRDLSNIPTNKNKQILLRTPYDQTSC